MSIVERTGIVSKTSPESKLYHAIAADNVPRVAELLPLVANVNNNLDLLGEAVRRSKDGETVRMLLERGASMVVAQGRQPYIIQAVSYGRVCPMTVGHLIAHGASPNTQSREGATLLSVVLRRFDVMASEVAMLVDAGASLNLRGADGDTAINHFVRLPVLDDPEWYSVMRTLVARTGDFSMPDAQGITGIQRLQDHIDRRHVTQHGTVWLVRLFGGRLRMPRPVASTA